MTEGSMLEIFIASGAGAAAVVFIDLLVRYCLYKRKNLQAAISIQIALHQMLGVSLQIRQFYDESLTRFLQINSNTTGLWDNFRYINFPPFMNTFDVVSFDWDFTQFISCRNNEIREVIKKLVCAKLGFQTILFVIKERNKLFWLAMKRIEAFRNANGLANGFEYEDDNLDRAIHLSLNVRLKDITDKYFKDMNDVIIFCHEAFNMLSTYIDENFCCAESLSLNFDAGQNQLLNEVIRNV